MTPEFIAFLESGRFPGIGLPVTAESLAAALGPPDAAERFATAWIYLYQACQFILSDDGTADCYLYFPMLADLGSPINVAPLSSATTLYDLIELLNEASVMWEIDHQHSFGDQVAVLTEGGVGIGFNLSLCTLNKLGCRLQCPQRHTTPESSVGA